MADNSFYIVTSWLLIICAASVHGAYEKDTYAFVMPKLVRPGVPFDISVIIFDAPGPVSTTAVLLDMENRTLSSATKTFSKGSPDILQLTVPRPLKMSKVQVEVRLGSGLNKVNRTEADVKQKTLSSFVQTDKAMYKPGQTVKFRTFSVYSDLTPRIGPVNITVMNTKGNRVKQFLNQTQPNGVVSHQLQLSPETALGQWKIQIDADGEKMDKTFDVDEYVLPKYEVTIDPPSLLTKWDSDFKVVVGAKYTFGQVVKGTVDITVRMKPYSNWDRSNYTVIRKTMQLDKGRAEFDVTDIQRLVPRPRRMYSSWDARNNLANRNIEINATVEETLTKKKLNTTTDLKIQTERFKLEFSDLMAKTFKQNMMYDVILQLTRSDGSPPQQSDLVSGGKAREVKVVFTMNYKYVQSYRSPTNTPRNWTFPSSGILKFSMPMPATDDIQSISFSAVFPNATRAYKSSIQMFESRDDEGIQLSMPDATGTVKAGDKAKFEVASTSELNTFFFQVLSKGELVVSRKETTSDPASKKYGIELDIDENLARQLAPNARILVWSISDSGEIITDSLDFTVAGIFANKVSLNFNRNETKPAENVELEVQADPNSSVFVLAVDQSVKLQATGNDIDEDMVSEELKKFDSTRNDHYYPGPMFRGRRKRSIMPWWPVSTGGSDSWEIFDNAGVIVLSDAYIHKKAPVASRPIFMMAKRGGGGVGGGGGWGGMPAAAMAGRAPPGAAAFGGLGPAMFKGSHKKVDEAKPSPNHDKVEPLEEASRIRQEFPETWIWTNTHVGADGVVSISAKTPDTITSWCASAFAINSVSGLGVAENPAMVNVFKPFFISLNLPYSIIRGEEFVLSATVFNYLKQTLRVTVTLPQSQLFKVKQNKNTPPQNMQVQTIVEVPANDGATVSFWMVPDALGQIPIEIKAQSTVAADAVKRNLLVKPPGQRKEFGTAIFIDLTKTPSGTVFTETLDSSLPDADVVPGSDYVSVTAIGDIMGPSLTNLDSLLRVPTGCGEQNMLGFAPNIYALQYLKAVGQSTSEQETKATDNMETGYQRELNYKHSDGSFSAFGERDGSGSSWLTSFVIKCYRQSMPFIPGVVDLDNIADAARFLIKNQNPDGSFNEPGRVIHREMQGNAGKESLSMDSYILISLVENKDVGDPRTNSEIATAISKTQTRLENKLPSITSIYELSIVTYALTHANSQLKDAALQKLLAAATYKDGQRYWQPIPDATMTTPAPKPNVWIPHYHKATPSTIEMTAYALLTLALRQEVATGLEVASFLMKQRNEKGGFASTQDTVIALEALSLFAAQVQSSGQAVDVTVQSDSLTHRFQQVTPTNSLLLQSVQMPKGTRSVNVQASGTGIALVQMGVKYNVLAETNDTAVGLDVKTEEDGDLVVVHSCAWLNNKKPDTPSGMMMMEISALSSHDPIETNDILKTEGVKRVEVTDDKRTVIYFDEFTERRKCIKYKQEKVFDVDKLQKAEVRAYSYYQNDEQNVQFYLPGQVNPGTICEACNGCCTDPNRRYTQMPIESAPEVINSSGSGSSSGPGVSRPEPTKRPNVDGYGEDDEKIFHTGGSGIPMATVSMTVCLSVAAFILQ